MQFLVVFVSLLALLALAPGRALNPGGETRTIAVPDESRCEACIKLIAIVKAYVSNPTTQQRILNLVLEDICPKLPADARQYCAIYTPIGIAAVAGWIESTEATEACGQARLCPDTALSRLKGSTADFALTHTPHVSRILAATSKLAALAADGDCDTCKMAVIELAAILADPATQKEILDYAEQGCATFPEYHDQCLTYVQMYGPLLLNAAVGYLNPDLCIRLGICAAA